MKLYRAFATVGGMTMASRVLGFVRDILIIAMLGTGPIADAFFVAFRLPNFTVPPACSARRLPNAAFVPIFAKRRWKGEARARPSGSPARRCRCCSPPSSVTTVAIPRSSIRSS
ncbi:MAG: hypothetical protein R3D33_00470 [Hyphomicrobiaceae bacterium]